MTSSSSVLRDAFLDSNIWLELLAVRSPQKPHEVMKRLVH